jgi:hypothetical protein
MATREIEVSIVLPVDLWEQLQGRAETEKENETSLLIRAIEQFLHQESTRAARNERLKRECDELAAMDFDDVGTEEEWLVIQNEALNKAEFDLVQ